MRISDIRLMAMEKGMTVWSAVEPLEPPPVDLCPPPVQEVQNTESQVSQKSSSCQTVTYRLGWKGPQRVERPFFSAKTKQLQQSEQIRTVEYLFLLYNVNVCRPEHPLKLKITSSNYRYKRLGFSSSSDALFSLCCSLQVSYLA
jgi:hypothetical protein